MTPSKILGGVIFFTLDIIILYVISSLYNVEGERSDVYSISA